MKISKLIKLLNKHKSEVGDIEVVIKNAESNNHSSIDYFLHDSNRNELVVCEEWYKRSFINGKL